MTTNKKEGQIWQAAYDKAYKAEYKVEYARLIQELSDEGEARSRAHCNADQQAKDIADAEACERRGDRC